VSQLVAEGIDLRPRHEPGLHELQRWRAGELPEAKRARVQDHVDGCSTCRARLVEMTAHDAHARSVLPFERLADGVARRSLNRQPRAVWRPVVGVALAAGLAALVVPGLVRPPSGNGIKGGGSDLRLYVGGVDEARRVLGEPVLQPSERIRLGYAAGDHRYLAVLSIDEQGQVTPLYPAAGASRPIGRREEQLLPDSIAFDGRGRERLMAVFSDAPLAVEELVAAAQARFASAGALSKMPPLGLGAEEIDRTVLKPGTMP
jgi:hypothetical protein